MENIAPSVKLYIEDLHVGQRFRTGTHRMTVAEIKTFAANYDPQPFHLDEEAAAHSLFGELVASGWHTASVTMRLIVESGLPRAGGVIGVSGELTWPRPTRPDDILQVESEIVELTPSKSRPDRGTARIRSITRNQGGEVVQDFTAKLIVRRRS
jgi:acyl dehydratase